MELELRIQNDIKEAMKAKDKDRLEALRAVKSAILLAKTEKGASEELSSDAEIKLLQRLLKQRKESAEIFEAQAREDLAVVERLQATVIQAYLPEAMGPEALRQLIADVMAEIGATSIKDLGKVMGAVNAKVAGRAEGKTVAQEVKSALESL